MQASDRAKMVNSLVNDKQILGALRYFYSRPWQLVKNFPDGIVPIDRRICAKTKCSPQQLVEESEMALARGCSQVRASSVQIETKRAKDEILVFPDVPVPEAYQIDGIQQFLPADQEKRFDFGPIWKNNSCALDSALVAILLLDMGRCRVDQVCEDLLRDSDGLSQATLSIIRKPWSKLGAEDIGRLRDVLREGLFRSEPEVFPLGGFHSVVNVFDKLTACMPQCLATWLAVVRCCSNGDWLVHMSTHSPYRSFVFNGLDFPTQMLQKVEEASTFQQTLQILLDPIPFKLKASQGLQRCNKCRNSADQAQRTKILLDRPPPTLTLRDSVGSEKRGFFEDVELKFLRFRKGKRIMSVRTRYACWGGIVTVNNNHFTVIANKAARTGGKDFVVYDDMTKNGRITPSKETFQEYLHRSEGDMVLLIYIRIS